jgi:putative glutamine amidotransferase
VFKQPLRRPSQLNGIVGVKTKKPIVGVIGNSTQIEGRFAVQMAGERNLRAIAEVAGALPLIFGGCTGLTDIAALLDTVDGIVLTGARANVHPTRFGSEPCKAHEPYDERRDSVALALAVACVARGVPVFGICRGLQEMNVAFGGTLHPEIREIPGRMNHRMPRLENGEIHPDPTVIFADRHDVKLTPGGEFARLLGCDTIRVNSLHGQGILKPGGRIVIEGVADDGTIEAIRIADAKGFALGVQWHAEYDPQSNPVNRALFQAFGDALHIAARAA